MNTRSFDNSLTQLFRAVLLPLAGAVILGTAASATAAPVVIDADGFVVGTNISNSFAGVTLATVDDAGATSPVFALGSAFASTPGNVFGHGDADPEQWGNGIWEFLRIDIAAGATQVQIDFIADDDGDSGGVLAAYDSLGNLLDFDQTPGGPITAGDVFSLTVAAADIAFVLALGDPLGDLADVASVTESGGGLDAWVLDNARITVVPEPASWVLAALAATGLAIGHRRRFGRRAVAASRC